MQSMMPRLTLVAAAAAALCLCSTVRGFAEEGSKEECKFYEVGEEKEVICFFKDKGGEHYGNITFVQKTYAATLLIVLSTMLRHARKVPPTLTVCCPKVSSRRLHIHRCVLHTPAHTPAHTFEKTRAQTPVCACVRAGRISAAKLLTRPRMPSGITSPRPLSSLLWPAP